MPKPTKGLFPSVSLPFPAMALCLSSLLLCKHTSPTFPSHWKMTTFQLQGPPCREAARCRTWGCDCLLPLCRVKCKRRQGLHKHTRAEDAKVRTNPHLQQWACVRLHPLSASPVVTINPQRTQIHDGLVPVMQNCLEQVSS